MRRAKAPRRRLRVLADYLAATRNEIAIDSILLATIGGGLLATVRIPRVPRWAGYAKRFPTGVRVLAVIARLGWRLGGSTLLCLREFLPRFLEARRRNDATQPAAPSYVLALSSRVGDILNKDLLAGLPNTWLTMPWAPLAQVPAGTHCIDVFDTLSLRDLWLALCNATTAQRRLHMRGDTAPWALQGYTAFKWFAVRTAVDRLRGQLVMAEHFDRWAVLVDRSVRADRGRSDRLEPRRRLTLVQHGSVAKLDPDNSSGGLLPLPTRLRSVARLMVYGPADEVAFREAVLGEPRFADEPLKVDFFKPRIELQSVLQGDGLKLLFVGHPICEPFQAALFDALRQLITIDAAYKPHPLAPMSRAMTSVGWKVISDPSTFPEVDLLISYPSTLVVEYAGLDIPAVVHSLATKLDEYAPIVAQVLAHARLKRSDG